MDTDSFIIQIDTSDFHKDIVDNVKNRYYTSNYEVDRPLTKIMNKNVIGLMKYELGGKIIIEFVGLIPKKYSYWTDHTKNVRKTKRTKKCGIKRILQFNDYKNCLFKNEIIIKSQRRFKSEERCVYTEEFKNIAPSNNDDKRLQASDRIRTYPYGKNYF